MDINWNLGVQRGPGAADSVAQGFEQGRAQKQRADMERALAALGTNPGDKTAMGEVMSQNPEMGQRFQARHDAQRVTQALGTGDVAGARQVATETGNLELLNQLDARTRAEVAERNGRVGQAALFISQLPEAERGAAWDAAIDQLAATMPELAAHKGKYSAATLGQVLAQTGQVDEWLKAQPKPQQPTSMQRDYEFLRGHNPELGETYLRNRADPTKFITVAPGGQAVQISGPGAGEIGGAEPPAEAIAELRSNPGTADQFDEIFGEGAAARVLSGGGQAPAGNGPF